MPIDKARRSTSTKPPGADRNRGVMAFPHARDVAQSWTRRVVRGLARGHGAGNGGDATVVRTMGQLVAIGPRPTARQPLDRPRVERSDLLAEWTRSGELSYGEAELLMALDETTPWRA